MIETKLFFSGLLCAKGKIYSIIKNNSKLYIKYIYLHTQHCLTPSIRKIFKNQFGHFDKHRWNKHITRCTWYHPFNDDYLQIKNNNQKSLILDDIKTLGEYKALLDGFLFGMLNNNVNEREFTIKYSPVLCKQIQFILHKLNINFTITLNKFNLNKPYKITYFNNLSTYIQI